MLLWVPHEKCYATLGEIHSIIVNADKLSIHLRLSKWVEPLSWLKMELSRRKHISYHPNLVLIRDTKP